MFVDFLYIKADVFVIIRSLDRYEFHSLPHFTRGGCDA